MSITLRNHKIMIHTYANFFLEIYSHTFISRERGDFTYGFMEQKTF